MARPGTWTKEQLVDIYEEIQKSGQSITDYCKKTNIGYHKLYQAFRRASIVGQYANSKPAKVAEPTPVASV